MANILFSWVIRTAAAGSVWFLTNTSESTYYLLYRPIPDGIVCISSTDMTLTVGVYNSISPQLSHA